jgi:hypothetical protein
MEAADGFRYSWLLTGDSNRYQLVELEKESTAGVQFAGVCDCDEAKRKSAVKV